jgi:N-methylhydantoinase A
MEAEGRSRLGEFSGPITVRRSVDMRYGEQIFEIQVPLDGVDLGAADVMDRIAERFHRRHEELYTYSAPDQDVVLVNARVAVIGQLPSLPAEPTRSAGSQAVAARTRRAWLGRWVEAPVYDLDALPPGAEIKGPAIFESPTTTVVVREPDHVVVSPHGWLEIRVG